MFGEECKEIAWLRTLIALGAGITSVLLEGSPVAPRATRFAHVIARHGVTVFKAGSTFLRQGAKPPR